jgi:hypothetical protein
MSCMSCASNYQTEFTGEMIIHFSGLKNLEKPGVHAFRKLSVCLNCGFSYFSVAERELALLANGSPGRERPSPERRASIARA